MGFFNKKSSAPIWAGRIAQPSETMPPEMAAMLLARDQSVKTIGKDDIRKASEILRKYKEGKKNLEDPQRHVAV